MPVPCAYPTLPIPFVSHFPNPPFSPSPSPSPRNLCVGNNDNRRRVAQAGGVEAVVKAMNDHPFDELLLQQTCHLLLHLSMGHWYVNSNNCEERRSLIGQAGGVEAVTKAMQRHPSFAELLTFACGVLWNLCFGNNDNRRRVAEAGGVEAVVKAMNDHPFDELVLERTCHLLLRLSTHADETNRKLCEERRSLIVQAGGVEAVTKAMQRHPSFAKLLKCACETLRNLCVDNDDNMRRVAQAGGVEAVVKAMNDRPFDRFLLEQTCHLLLHLSTYTDEKNRKECEERKALIGKAGGVEAVTKAMRRHPSLVALLKNACMALTNLVVGNDDNMRRVAQAGGWHERPWPFPRQRFRRLIPPRASPLATAQDQPFPHTGYQLGSNHPGSHRIQSIPDHSHRNDHPHRRHSRNVGCKKSLK